MNDSGSHLYGLPHRVARGVVGLAVTLGGVYFLAVLAGPMLSSSLHVPPGPGVCAHDAAVQAIEFDYPNSLLPGASAVVRGGAEVCVIDPGAAQVAASYLQWWSGALWLYGAFIGAAIVLSAVQRHGASSPRSLKTTRALGWYLLIGSIAVHTISALAHWKILDGVTTTWSNPWVALLQVHHVPWTGLVMGLALLLVANVAQGDRSPIRSSV
ncbi:hypothetical protein IEU95_08685 [Hoyosella rhizosphaerae]|nr:hypothetical protein [Hoyosella rhizosphaerae]MBN4926905.1 hypothetical protein [Hoyosella rhizosphaerae]